MDLLVLWDGRRVGRLKKIPRTVLVVDGYGTITEEEMRMVRDSAAGMTVDFKERVTHYSLVILCNAVLRFDLENPLTLVECEIWFARQVFSSKVFADALEYYSQCEIRNGV